MRASFYPLPPGQDLLSTQNRKSFDMASATRSPAYRTPAQAKALVKAFLDPHLQIGRLSQQAEILLADDDNLIRAIGEITLEDQERLVDRIDQVRLRDRLAFSPVIFSHRAHLGLCERQRGKRQVLGVLRKIMQCHKTTPSLSYNFDGARDPR